MHTNTIIKQKNLLINIIDLIQIRVKIKKKSHEIKTKHRNKKKNVTKLLTQTK